IGSVAMAEDFQQRTVWKAGEGGYHTYRIPAAMVTSKGTLLAFCEGRRNSPADVGEINLVLKRSSDNGKTFSEHQVIWADGPNTCDNPCPVVDESTGKIWLLMCHSPGVDDERKITHEIAKKARTIW